MSGADGAIPRCHHAATLLLFDYAAQHTAATRHNISMMMRHALLMHAAAMFISDTIIIDRAAISLRPFAMLLPYLRRASARSS